LLEKYYYLGLHMDDMVPTPQQEVTNSISEIIAYFLKSKNVMWPWSCTFKGQFIIPMLNCHLTNQCIQVYLPTPTDCASLKITNTTLHAKRNHQAVNAASDI